MSHFKIGRSQLRYAAQIEAHLKRAERGGALKRKQQAQELTAHALAGDATKRGGRRVDGRRVGPQGQRRDGRRGGAAAAPQGATLYVRVWHVARVRLRLNGANDLRAADISLTGKGKADPYCTVKFKGKRVGKTRVQKSTLNPRWYAIVEFTIPTHAAQAGQEADVLVEVWDHDLVGSHDFLGCVAVPRDCMLRPHCGDVWELGPRVNGKAKDPVVTGFLDMQIEASFIQKTMERVPWPRAPPDLTGSGDVDHDEALKLIERQMRDLTEAKAETDKLLWGSRDIREAFDAKSGRRYWFEKLHGRERYDHAGEKIPPEKIPRWWRDPRPHPEKPPSVFTIPDRPPRPSPTKRKYAKLNELEPGDKGFELRPSAVVECCVLRAGGLKDADTGFMAGGSDPYATVRYGPPHSVKTVGRTKVINDANDPVWGDGRFRFPMRVDADCADHQILVEVWDSDGGSMDLLGDGDDALGQAVFAVEDYINALGPIRSVLRPQPGEDSVTGWVEIRTQLLGTVRLHLGGLEFGGDPDAGLGSPDKHGKRRRKKVECAPRWKGWAAAELPAVRDKEAFYVDVPLTREGGCLEIACRYAGSKKKLGVCRIPAEALLADSGGVSKLHKLREIPFGAAPEGTSLLVRVEVPTGLQKLAAAARGARTVADTENTLPALAAVEVDIIRATNLKQADAFSLSDPFVVGYSAGEKLGPTKVIQDNLNPVWPADRSSTFRVEKFRTVEDIYDTQTGGRPRFDATDYAVVLEVLDSDGPGRPTKFLGHCILRHADLLIPGERELELAEKTELRAERLVAQHGRRRETGERPKRSYSQCLSQECGACGKVPKSAYQIALAIGCLPVWAVCCLTRQAGKCCASCGRHSLECLYFMEDYFCPCCWCKLPRRQPIRGRLLVRIRHFAEVQLRVMEAYDLAAVDEAVVYGAATSDPYCVIEYGGKKLAKTKYKSKTLDPHWYEHVTLEVEVPQGHDDLEQLPWEHPGRAHLPSDASSLKITVWDHDTFSGDDPIGQVVIRPEFFLRPQNGTHWPVKPLPGTSSETPLGWLELRVQASRVPGRLEPAPRRQYGALGDYRERTDQATGRDYWYDLWTKESFWTDPRDVARKQAEMIRDAESKRKNAVLVSAAREHAQAKKASRGARAAEKAGLLVAGLDNLSLDPREAQAVVAVTIVRAADLENVDGRLGCSDPYIAVKLGGSRAGKTTVKNDSLNPEYFETVQAVVPLEDVDALEIVVECWDYDKVGDDDLMGSARVPAPHGLVAAVDRVYELELQGGPGERPARGSVTVHVSLKFKTVLEINSFRRMTQGSAPLGIYCAAVWDGREQGEAGRTDEVTTGALTLWDCKLALAVPARAPADHLVLEVREHRKREADLVLGAVRLDASTLLPVPKADDSGDPTLAPVILESPILRFPLRDPLLRDLSKPVEKRARSRRRGMMNKDVPNQTQMENALGEAALDPSWRDEMSILTSDSESEEDGDDRTLATHQSEQTHKSEHSDAMAKAAARFRDKRKRETLFSKMVDGLRRLLPKKPAAAVPRARGARSTTMFSKLMNRQEEEMDEGQDGLFAVNPMKPPEADEPLKVAVMEKERPKSRKGRGEDLGDVLTVRSVPPAGTVQAYAAWLHLWEQRPSANTLATTAVEVEILRGDNLIRADLLGKSDPFVRVYAGGAEIGKTKTKNRTLHPKWVAERFVMPRFRGKARGTRDTLAARLELRVFDEDLVGSDDFLGYHCLEHEDILRKEGWRTLKLKDDPAGIVGKQPVAGEQKAEPLNRGTLTIRTRIFAHVRITLIGLHGLREQDDDKDAIPDPYARVRYMDKDVGDPTPPREDTLAPVWYHTVDVNVPVPDDEVWGDALSIVVLDKNATTGVFVRKNNDDILGAAEIPHEQLVYPHDTPGIRPVLTETGETVGYLTVAVESSRVPGRLEPRRDPESHPVYATRKDPRTGRGYWYDECTKETMWDDPRPAHEALAAEIAEFERANSGTGNVALPLALLRAKRGFPEPPRAVAAAGGSASARVWWKPSRVSGPPVLGFTVERQRRREGEETWEDKGCVFVDAQAQIDADTAAAKAAGRMPNRAEREHARKAEPPCALIVDGLANDAFYRFRVSSRNEVGDSIPSPWSNDARVVRPLPEGWREVVPEAADELPYYYNPKTRQTTWVLCGARPEADPFALPTDVFLRFTPDELVQLKLVFQEMDVDRSRNISLKEFEACLPALGELLSPTDVLWLFYQADLDPAAELSYEAFAKAVDTLKRARVERAPAYRWMGGYLKEKYQFYTRPKVPRQFKKLVADKQEEMIARVGAWEKIPHPEIPGAKYWRNPETGDASYDSPAEVRHFLPEALIQEAAEHMTETEMENLEDQFDAIDLDGSGAVDLGELKLLIKAITGKTLSDGKARGLMYEVDADHSGQMDFDEFVLAMLMIKKGKLGNTWSRMQGALERGHQNSDIAEMRENVDLLKLQERRKGKRRPHGHYCVCGCRAINKADEAFMRGKKRGAVRLRSIFPRLSAQQLKAQSAGGGASAAQALASRDAIDGEKYTAANLVPFQPRMAERMEVPKWSMIQTNRKRLAVVPEGLSAAPEFEDDGGFEV